MDDLISRQAAIDALNHEYRCGDIISQCRIEIAIDIINELPPAQPELKTGVWLTYTNVPQYMLCKCSACGADILVPYAGKNMIFNYCPNCGAKMEGDLT